MGKLHINLLGTSFTIQASEDSEYLSKLLGYYERITKDVGRIDSVKTPLQVSILSGIMLCDELYKEKTKYMLSKAKPLMTIYKEKDKKDFEELLKKEKKSNVKKLENSSFKNIDFYICKNKWISINKKTSPEMHFVIHNYKLKSAIESFLT